MTLRNRLKSATAVTFVLLAIGSLSPVVSQSQRTLTWKSEQLGRIRTDGHRPLPLWTGGMLLSVEVNQTPEPVLWAVDRTGSPQEIRFTIPGASYVVVRGLAGAADGTLILHGSTYDDSSRGGSFLAIIAPDRSKKTIVRLVPYYPTVATIAPDGIIWMIGYDDARKQHNVLKRFDLAGNVISTKDLRAKGSISADANEASTLRASKDRVGWMTNTYEYVEFSLDGTEIKRFHGPPWHPSTAVHTSFEINERDEVVAAVNQPTQHESILWRLDRSKGAWFPVGGDNQELSETSRLLGLDGEDLVIYSGTANRGPAVMRFRFPTVN